MKTKAQNGQHHNSIAPYGFKPSKDDPCKWDIDETAAEVVREIYQMCIDGKGTKVIALELRARNLDRPDVYRRKREGLRLIECKYPNNHWCASNISDILSNIEYIGTAVTNKVRVKSYKDKTRIYLPEEEWTMFENAHPAIINQETFDTVQRIRDGRRRPTKLGDMGVLNGRLYCEGCGGKLHIKRRANGDKAQYVYYMCHRSRSQSDSLGDCTPHSVRKEIIEQLVFSDLQRVLALARDSEERFVELVRKQSQKENEKAVRKAKSEYAKAENRFAQLDAIINQIYEDKVSGEISAERFTKMLGTYEKEQADLTTKMNELRPLIMAAAEQAQGTERFLRLVKRYTEIEELTAEIVNEFIERIVVGETELVAPRRFSHWKDEKRQNIRIVYNYVGAVPSEGEPITADTRGKKAYSI